jgi:hypothetical protein
MKSGAPGFPARTGRPLAQFAAATFLAAMIAGPALGQSPPVPVIVGGSADLDACQTLGQVRGLKAGGDGFLSVRNGPSTRHAELDRLANGRQVYFCARKGYWVGIVYGSHGSGCGVTSPIARKRVYRGPCRSGWVHGGFLEPLAG